MMTNFFPLVLQQQDLYRYLVQFDPPIEADQIVRRRIALKKFMKEIEGDKKKKQTGRI